MNLRERYIDAMGRIKKLQSDNKIVQIYSIDGANKIEAEIENIRQKFVDSIDIEEVLYLALKNSERIDELVEKENKEETTKTNKGCGKTVCKSYHCLEDNSKVLY